ncbi:glycoside hydrolase family 79 protein [Polychaeton citri CBS 116435]|uniref:Glycoside hydrolase family 79 protein n=1 Tax=Polychaeton citri CBS 116435 TaxID=1314669 RepID=A0A9P4QG99_9PEZI|nr:glycoside hydrolase family 79 protein [Polychaeton citri CBS 116435]
MSHQSIDVGSFVFIGRALTRAAIHVPTTPGYAAGVPLNAFVSYSIEFSSFPDFAGNSSNPNVFSNNLLKNLEAISRTKPYIRVGGNTQDYVVFDASQGTALVGMVDPEKSPDYPTTITIGPAYFQSYSTWPGTKYIHGFNLGRNSTTARQGLIDSVTYACKALGDGKLAYWELGNEPDLFKTSSQGPVRPAGWNEQDYVTEWLRWTGQIRNAMRKACPKLATDQAFQFYAPSFAGVSNSLDPITTWQQGLDADRDIALITTHNYISGAEVPGVTLQHTLMNHTANIASIAKQLNESHLLQAEPDDTVPPGPYNSRTPFIMGETNSLYNQGRPGLSNTFGAALWGVDFNLWCATNNISRVHMHQGTNYRYQSWQPIETNITAKGTKAPYYGNIAVATFLGELDGEMGERPKVVNLPLPREEESAYASYVDGQLASLIVINMQQYNATDYNAEYINHYARPVERYEFQLPGRLRGNVQLQRMMANGSDAITGCTFGGYSYNYELDNGMPVRLNNVTAAETARVGRDGRLSIVLQFDRRGKPVHYR